MQLNIITGPQGSGKTTKLRELLESHSDQAHARIIDATFYATSELAGLVQLRIKAGDTCILIDDCTTCQIGQLRKLTLPGGPKSEATKLTIHAVQQA